MALGKKRETSLLSHFVQTRLVSDQISHFEAEDEVEKFVQLGRTRIDGAAKYWPTEVDEREKMQARRDDERDPMNDKN